MDVARMRVSTTHPNLILQLISVRINGQLFYLRVSEEISGETLHVSRADDFRKVDGERAHIAEEPTEDSREISTSLVPCTLDELIGASSTNDARTENGMGDKEMAISSKVVS
ncbi:hypothetical protein Ancab_011501, partial [Ancistrocladus abbreviatus]